MASFDLFGLLRFRLSYSSCLAPCDNGPEKQGERTNKHAKLVSHNDIMKYIILSLILPPSRAVLLPKITQACDTGIMNSSLGTASLSHALRITRGLWANGERCANYATTAAIP